jgi:transposase-like protein
MKTMTVNQATKPFGSDSPVAGPTEGAPGATGVGPATGGGSGRNSFSPPDPEVAEKKPRRKFTAKYKLEILEKADACDKPGQLGALLRKEGLYSSHLTTWRRQRSRGMLKAMSPRKRGRKPMERNPLADEVARLQKEKRDLQTRLKQAELIVEAQKKISEILQIAQTTNDNGGTNS